MKNIFKHLAFYQLYLTLKNTEKSIWVRILTHIFILISPFLFTFIAFNIVLLTGAFIGWTWPHHFYIPFMGGDLQDYYDRLLVLIGIVMCITKE